MTTTRGGRNVTVQKWEWRNQAADYGQALAAGYPTAYELGLSTDMTPAGQENGSLTATSHVGGAVVDSWVLGDQVSYRDTLEFGTFDSTGAELEGDVADDMDKRFRYFRVHRVKTTTNNEDTHGGAENVEQMWATGGPSYPSSTGIRNFTLATGLKIWQAFKVEEFGYSPWRRTPAEGISAANIAALALLVPPVASP